MGSPGKRRHLVSLENPGPNVPNADGGFDSTWVTITPDDVWASVEPATQRSLERLVASTVASDASHVVTMPFISGVTTKTRVTFKGRTLNVVGVQNVEERDIELRLACVEQVD